MKRIGERIRKKRELQDINLNELAEKVGISPSALSQIENSKSFPSIITFKSIAENLHTTVGELMGENEALAGSPVVFKKDMKLVNQNSSGTLIYLLSKHDINKQMDTYLIRFSRASGIEGFFADTFGQIFCHVLSGKIRFELEGNQYLVKQGDSMYFNSKDAYDVINVNGTISELIWIQSPPVF